VNIMGVSTEICPTSRDETNFADKRTNTFSHGDTHTCILHCGVLTACVDVNTGPIDSVTTYAY
jgi:hypothetical protein